MSPVGDKATLTMSFQAFFTDLPCHLVDLTGDSEIGNFPQASLRDSSGGGNLTLPDMTSPLVLYITVFRVSIAMKRLHDHDNSYKGKHLIGRPTVQIFSPLSSCWDMAMYRPI